MTRGKPRKCETESRFFREEERVQDASYELGMSTSIKCLTEAGKCDSNVWTPIGLAKWCSVSAKLQTKKGKFRYKQWEDGWIVLGYQSFRMAVNDRQSSDRWK